MKNQSLFSNHFLIVFNDSLKNINSFCVDGLNVIELPYKNITFSSVLPIYKNIKKLIAKESITHLHPWCTTAGALAFLLKKYYPGKLNLVIDSFEPHAEAMVQNGEWSRLSLKFKLLFYLEKQQAKHADHLIFAAAGMETYVQKKYQVNVKNYSVKPACVNLDMFSENKKKNSFLMKNLGIGDNIVCVYAGKFGGIYLDEEVFQFISCALSHWGDRFRFLLLSNITEQDLMSRLNKFNIARNVIIKQFVEHKNIADYIGLADFAICPVKPVPSKRYCSPIKNGEYWAMGLPVVITPNISIDSDVIEKNNIGYVLKSLTTEEYLKAVRKIDHLRNEAGLTAKIRKIAENFRNYSIAEEIYTTIYS